MEDKYPPEYWQEMVDEIMDNFDFDRVHLTMQAINWHWHNEPHVPNVQQIRKHARKALRECVIHDYGGNGGFETSINREHGCLTLKFVVEKWDAYDEALDD